MKDRQLKIGVILNYVIIALNGLVGIVYTPFMLRMLGQSEYGLYSLAASVIAYLSILDLGFGNAVIRYTAKYRAEGKVEEQHVLFGMFTMIYSVLGLLVVIGGIYLTSQIDTMFAAKMTTTELARMKPIMMLMTFNLAITFPLSIYGAIITAYERFVFLRVVQIVRIILNMLVMICLLTMGYKALALVVVQTIFNVSTLLLNFCYAKKKIHVKLTFKKFDYTLLREIVIYSFWIFLNVIMDRIYWSTGQFVLGITYGTVAVAVFAVAIQLENIYMTFSTAISGVFLPKITAMVSTGKSNQELSNLFISTGRIQYLILSFILTGFIVFGQSFINVWAGDGYEEAYIITLLFMMSLIIPLIQNIGISILQARNQMKFRSLLYVIIAAISLAFQFPMAEHYGPIGCAITIAGALFLGHGIIMNVYYHSIQKIDIIEFWKEIARMSIVPICMTVVSCYITSFFVIDSIVILVISIVAYSCLYLPLLYKFSMNGYERDFILNAIKKITKK